MAAGIEPIPIDTLGRERGHARPRRRLAIELAVGYVGAWLVGVGFGFAMEGLGIWEKGATWERATLGWFHARPLPLLLDKLMLAVPYVGTNLTILPLMIVVGLLLWRRYRQPLLAVHLLVVSVGSLSLNPTMKHLLDRPRPDLYPLRGMWTWASYPSGHIILTTALYFTLALLLRRDRGWVWPFFVAPVIVFVTAYSRFYLSVHWPTDLVGGLLIGITWLLATWFAFSRYRQRTIVA